MIRTLLVLAMLAVPVATAAAPAPGETPVLAPRPLDAPGAIVVQVQPRDRYVVYLDATGKDAPTMYREIGQAVWIACLRSPVSNNALDSRPSVVMTCVSRASQHARAQVRQILDAREAAALTAGG